MIEEEIFYSGLDEEQYGGEAMTTLIRLDRGLRSNIVSQQCDSIIRCGQLINQFPLPVIINTTLLKLADLFRGW